MSNALTSGWRHYHSPATPAEAIEALQHYDGRARVVGGGTDLLVELRRGLRRPIEALVDAARIAGMNAIEEQGDHIVLGCGVTHSQIVRDTRINRYGTCLAESCSVIGGPQVRNVGTLAGNVAHALPAGDGTIGLLALDGEVEVFSNNGTRWIPMHETFAGPGRSRIDRHRELITRLRFKAETDRVGSAHHRVMRPQGLCLPIISIAARLELDDDDTIRAARISMGPVGPVPYLAEPAMQALIGGPATRQQFDHAAEIALEHVTLRASKYRATQDYRARMVRTWLPAILERAAQRAGLSTGDCA